MNFVKQRALQAIDPLLALLVMIPLAVAGLGYWSLVVGAVAGSMGAALVALRVTPYRIALRYDVRTAGRYFRFSVPLLADAVSGWAAIQAILLVGAWTFGLAGVGWIYLALGLSMSVTRVGYAVARSLYPAICAVRDRGEVLLESFLVSSRATLLVAAPLGIGIALFAPDLITFVLGERWRPAQGAMQGLALLAIAGEIAVAWRWFYEAHGRTGPIGVVAALSFVLMAGVAAPLVAAMGLTGLVVGVAISDVVLLMVRFRYVRGLFPGARAVMRTLPALLPAVPAAFAVLGLRSALTLERTPALAAAEMAGYVALVIAITWVSERALLRELLGYLRVPRPVGPILDDGAVPGRVL
jgi:O-antigen/teichoic acid export membrane protein